MTQLKLWAAITVIAIAPCTYAGPGGPGGGHAGGPGMSPMGDASHTNMDTHSAQANSNSPTELLSRNTRLSSNLEKLLPAGTTAQQACGGFKNLGSCVAAVHVAHNLDIQFADLKPKVTGSAAVSLGKAIHAMKPDADAKAETRKAESQAREDLRA